MTSIATSELESRLDHETAEGVELIQNPDVSGIGEGALVALHSEVIRREYTGRTHDQHTVELDGHRHSVLITNPLAWYSETDIYFMPGYTQTTDEPGGVGFKLHTELARRHPEARIISLGSTGIGKFGDRITDPLQASMAAMAEQRYRLIQAIGGDRRKHLLTLSMSTVVGNGVAQHDLANGMTLNIVGDIKYVPAQVDPRLVTKDMKLKFPVLMGPDALRELFDPRSISSPRRFAATVCAMGHLGLGLADVPALFAQIRSITSGTETALTESEAENYRTVVTAGRLDPLAQIPMWEKCEDKHGLVLRIIPRRGHGMAVDAVGGASNASRIIKELDANAA